MNLQPPSKTEPSAMSKEARPLLAVTMGDPAGIGPEVVAKALARPELYQLCRPLVVGDFGVMSRTIQALALPVKSAAAPRPADGHYQAGRIDVLDLGNVHPDVVPTGQVSAPAGRAAMDYVLRAVELTRTGEADAIVTAPINKEATLLAGYTDMGHMELFARLFDARGQATMLVSGRLRVVHMSTHYSLLDAIARITEERVTQRIVLTDSEFRRWGMARPRIAVAALNPHGGEGGHLGREEIETIAPSIEAARGLGIEVSGPYPADSIFVRALRGEFDAVVAMYHDQGHIPVKVHGFEQSVSVALGLPIIRTSVDHGTAFDIAGEGVADASSMAEAVRVAAEICAGTWLHPHHV